MNASFIEQLVQARGIESQYVDAWGAQTIIKQESKEKILEAMGYPVHDEQALMEVVNKEMEQNWLTVVEPATIVRSNEKAKLSFKLPIDFANDELKVVIRHDVVDVQTESFVPVDQELVASVEVKDMEIQQYLFEFEQDLPIGYYDVSIYESGVEEALGTGTSDCCSKGLLQTTRN